MYFVALKCANYHENNSCPNLVHLMAFVYAILHVKSCPWTWCNQMLSCMPFGMQRTPCQPYGARILISTQSTSNGAYLSTLPLGLMSQIRFFLILGWPQDRQRCPTSTKLPCRCAIMVSKDLLELLTSQRSSRNLPHASAGQTSPAARTWRNPALA